MQGLAFMRMDDPAEAEIFIFNSVLNNKNDDLVIQFGSIRPPESWARMG